MTVWTAALWIFGVAACLLGICLVTVWVERKWPSPAYDERQKVARGNGFRLSFFVGAFYGLGVLAYYMVPLGGPKPQVEGYLLVFAGIMLQALVTHFYGLLTHSALPFSQNPVRMVVCYLLIGGSQLINLLVSQSWTEGMPPTGKGSEKWVYLILTVGCFLLATSYLVSMLPGKPEEE